METRELQEPSRTRPGGPVSRPPEPAGLFGRPESVAAAVAGLLRRMDDTAPDFECMFEMYFERRVPGIFREWLLRARPVYHDELPGIDEARDAGTLSEQEMAQVAALDIILYGRFRDSREQGYLAVEISRTVNPDDVERASERAAILRKAGLPARAAVGGRRITAEAEKFARDDGVIVAILRTEPA